MLLNTKIFCRLGFVFTIFFMALPGIHAQEIDASEEKKGVAWRLGFWEVLHQTFSDDESHPFYQMTGTNRFRAGKGFFGSTFIDIMSLAYTTASLRKVANVIRGTATAPATPSVGAMSDNTQLSGIIGDVIRIQVVTTGTYGGSTTLDMFVQMGVS